MACTLLKLMGAPHIPITRQRDLLISRPVAVAAKMTASHLQVRREGDHKLQTQKAVSVSRRDAILCLAAEILSGIAMVSAEPAEARVTKLEQKRKIMEKLEKLREKAGVSKTKTENRVDTPPAQTLRPQPLVEAILTR